MSYSQKRHLNIESDFPPPPEWLVWHADRDYQKSGGPTKTTGQVRHYPTLQKAKKSIYGYGGKFYTDWAIYHWEGDKYVLQFQGAFEGLKVDHELFKMRLKASSDGREFLVDDNDVEQAIASILRSA